MIIMDELVITEENFDKYFFDVRKHNPQKGQIMVVYRAMAKLVKGPEKKQLIDLLCQTDKAVAASQVMKKLLFACEEDSVRVPLEIVNDLKTGFSIDKVLKKPYKYKIEIFYYTWPECVPNDPHWESISLLNLSDFFKAQENAKEKNDQKSEVE